MKFLNYIRGRSACDFRDKIGVSSNFVSFKLQLVKVNGLPLSA